MTNLRSTAPHFVRCIIPNETKTPGKNSSLIAFDLPFSLLRLYVRKVFSLLEYDKWIPLVYLW